MPKRNGVLSAVVALEVSNFDVAGVAKGLQIIVMIPTPGAVTTTVSGHDVIDLNAAPRRADPTTLAPPFIPASDQPPGQGPIVLVPIPASAGVATPSPASFRKSIAATPTMPLLGGYERACQDETHVNQSTKGVFCRRVTSPLSLRPFTPGRSIWMHPT